MMRTSEWMEVADVNEISPGTMKHVDVDRKEILLANVNGKFYAINDRCVAMSYVNVFYHALGL